jgi:hypothetical protein
VRLPRKVQQVPAIVERPPLTDEPIVDVFAAGVAHGQQPVVTITSVADAVDLPAPQVPVQPFRREPASRPLLSIGGARLIPLGRGDPFKADVLASDDDRVAVDDPGRAGNIRLRGEAGAG